MRLIKKFYSYLKIFLNNNAPNLYLSLDRRKTIIKYIIAGGTATAVDLGLLYALTDILSIYYLLSAALAFIAAFFVSFYLQKFWTFRDNRRDNIHKQMTMYLAVGVINLGVNSLGMYVLVDHIHLLYMIAQIIMCASVPIITFAAYKFIIFKKPANEQFEQ